MQDPQFLNLNLEYLNKMKIRDLQINNKCKEIISILVSFFENMVKELAFLPTMAK